MMRRSIFRKFIGVSFASSVLAFVRAQQAACASSSTALNAKKHTDELRRLRTENARLKQEIYADEEKEMAELRRENELLNAQKQELEAKPKTEDDAPAARAAVPVVPFDDLVHDLFERPLWLSRESSLMREFDRAFNDMGLFPWDLRRPFAQGAFSMAGPLTSLKEMESEVNKVQAATEKQLAESMGEEVKCQMPTQQSYAMVDVDGVQTKSVSLRCKAKAMKSGKECDVQVRGMINDDNSVDLDALFLDGSKLIGPAEREQKQVSDEPAQATG